LFERPVIFALLTTVNIKIIFTGCDTSYFCGKVPPFISGVPRGGGGGCGGFTPPPPPPPPNKPPNKKK